MHEIQVSVMSPEAADHGIAEFWAGRESIGFTVLEDGDLMLRIEPRRDGTAVVVGARSLAEALGRANRLLESSQRAFPRTPGIMAGKAAHPAPCRTLGPDPEPLGSERFMRVMGVERAARAPAGKLDPR